MYGGEKTSVMDSNDQMLEGLHDFRSMISGNQDGNLQCKCQDKADIPHGPEDAEKNNWRLNRVTEIEENKLHLCMLPIWGALVTCGTVLSTKSTLFIEQAYSMDRQLGSVRVPVTSLSMLAGLPSVVRFLPLDTITKLRGQITPKLQIGLGIFSSMLACMTAALVERRRLSAYNRGDFIQDKYGYYNRVNMNIFLLLPQFFFTNIILDFAASGVADFFDDHLPDCMKGFALSFLLSALAAGAFFSALLATIVNKATKWFGHDINSSRVDNLYWGLGILSSISLCIYAYISWGCTWRCNPVKKGEENENDPNIGNSNENENDSGNNNDNGEATTSAQERTTTIEVAKVEQQESGDPNISGSNENENNNDNSEATTSAQERTTTIEIATVEQQESGDPNISNSNENENYNGNNDNSEAIKSAEERTTTIEMAAVEQQKLGTCITSYEQV